MHLWVGMSLFFGEGSLFFFVKGKLVFYWWSETRLVGRKPGKFNNFGKLSNVMPKIFRESFQAFCIVKFLRLSVD